MREFNTFGPVRRELHYHVDRVGLKSQLKEKIRKGRYFTLNAARQAGQSTLFQEATAELTQQGGYLGVLLECDGLSRDSPELIYERLSHRLRDAMEPVRAADPAGALSRHIEAGTVAHHHALEDYLRELGRLSGQSIVLILDEFDALPEPVLTPLLGTFRSLYHHRYERDYHAPQSVVLVGVRSIPSLLAGTQSPFNIADQFDVPYFTEEEVAGLLSQHTAETGQAFAPDVVAGVYRESEGQPFLVNRLAQILTQRLVPDRARTITPLHLSRALATLLSEDNTHFASIASKAAAHRDELLPILFYDERRSNFLDPVVQDLVMYGVLRALTDEDGLPYARIGNPIYRKLLVLRFATPRSEMPISGAALHRHVVGGALNFDGLMDSFKRFMEEHGVRLLRGQGGKPLEMSGQYLLLSYLSASLNSIGGHVTIESLSSAGEMDVLAFYRGARFIVETKVWYGAASLEQGKSQLARYLTAAGLAKGYLVVFDEDLPQNAVAAAQGQVFELALGDKTLRVYLIAVHA